MYKEAYSRHDILHANVGVFTHANTRYFECSVPTNVRIFHEDSSFRLKTTYRLFQNKKTVYTPTDTVKLPTSTCSVIRQR